ncbi:MAG: D-galactarate dehydratase [Thaumarchaeota archaeon]|nr:MAG: D-galactarate dehydratase [Nitrososphaerota archaeon]
MRRAVMVNPADNVAVVLEEVKKGESVLVRSDGRELRLIARSDIPFGHKIAVKDIPKGGEVVKYGEVIGRALSEIKAGDYVHIHNVESLRGRGDLKLHKE